MVTRIHVRQESSPPRSAGEFKIRKNGCNRTACIWKSCCWTGKTFFIPGAVLLEAMCKPRSKLTKPCNVFVTRTQESSSTLGDVYEVCAEAGSGNTEKLQIFDTPGDVSVFTSGAYFRNECF